MLFLFVHGCDEVLFRYPDYDLSELDFRFVLKELVLKVQLDVGLRPFYELFDLMKLELDSRFGCVRQVGFGYVARKVSMVYDVYKGLGFLFENKDGEESGSFFPLKDELDNNSFCEVEK